MMIASLQTATHTLVHTLLTVFLPPPCALLPALPISLCSEELKGYLSTRFTLRSGDRPHLMKF